MLLDPGVVTLVIAILGGIIGAVALLFLFCRPALAELARLGKSMRASRAAA
jgi:O-antigen ligase